MNLIHGDCLEKLKELPDNSVDSVVTDPPYHLTSIVKRFGKEGSAPAKFGKDGAFARASAGFMGHSWDAPEPLPIDPDFANWFAGFTDGEGCFSVHKKTINGYETYDCQFSINLRADDKPILAEIQKKLGGIGSLVDRPERNEGKPQARYCISSKKDCQRLQAIFSVFELRAKKKRDFEIWSNALDSWVTHEPGDSWEEVAYFRQRLMEVRKFGSTYRPEELFFYRVARESLRVLKPGGYIVAFSSTRTYHRMTCSFEDAGFVIHPMLAWVFGQGMPKAHRVDAPGFEGWRYGGQSLKPAFEPILFAQKPFSEKTGTKNVLKWGTGAVNIDGCRVPTEANVSDLGRWPANFIHDGSDEVIELFPQSKGQAGDVKGSEPSSVTADIYGKFAGRVASPKRGDQGSAARFFYTAKTPKSERNIGGTTNSHPTVKPKSLMAYLCRLVTPPGGTVLDPFMGSGSTGLAAIDEGFKFIGIERETEYFEIAQKRIEHIKDQKEEPLPI
jgi:DNA modification methylase